MTDTEPSIRPTAVRVILTEAIVLVLLWWLGYTFGR
jgi:hypothetical protein